MTRTKRGYVYILTNKPRGTLYIGVTSVLDHRLDQHDQHQGSSFAKKYRLRRLVYIEEYPSITEAIAREKQLKNWHRQWKINLIEKLNPEWRDLLRDSETSLPRRDAEPRRCHSEPVSESFRGRPPSAPRS